MERGIDPPLTLTTSRGRTDKLYYLRAVACISSGVAIQCNAMHGRVTLSLTHGLWLPMRQQHHGFMACLCLCRTELHSLAVSLACMQIQPRSVASNDSWPTKYQPEPYLAQQCKIDPSSVGHRKISRLSEREATGSVQRSIHRSWLTPAD